jgi:hypothetical protein
VVADISSAWRYAQAGHQPRLTRHPDYQPPFKFTGTLHTGTFNLSGDLITDTEAEMLIAMARQ